MKRIVTITLLIFVCMMCLVLCDTQGLEAKNSSKKSVKKITKVLRIARGQTHKIKLKNIKKYTFSSSDTEIATVNKKGVIKGKHSGKCTIKASSKKKKYVYKLTVKSLGGIVAVLNGIVTNIEVISENTERYTIELKFGGNSFIHGDNVFQKKYYVADLDIGKGVKVGESIILFTYPSKETCEGTLIDEDTVFLTGVH